MSTKKLAFSQRKIDFFAETPILYPNLLHLTPSHSGVGPEEIWNDMKGAEIAAELQHLRAAFQFMSTKLKLQLAAFYRLAEGKAQPDAAEASLMLSFLMTASKHKTAPLSNILNDSEIKDFAMLLSKSTASWDDSDRAQFTSLEAKLVLLTQATQDGFDEYGDALNDLRDSNGLFLQRTRCFLNVRCVYGSD
jgi:hypothetical protein